MKANCSLHSAAKGIEKNALTMPSAAYHPAAFNSSSYRSSNMSGTAALSGGVTSFRPQWSTVIPPPSFRHLHWPHGTTKRSLADRSLALLIRLFFVTIGGNCCSCCCCLGLYLSHSVLKCSLGPCLSHAPLRALNCGSRGTGQAPVQGEKLLGFIGLGKTLFYQVTRQFARVHCLFSCKVPGNGR